MDPIPPLESFFPYYGDWDPLSLLLSNEDLLLHPDNPSTYGSFLDPKQAPNYDSMVEEYSSQLGSYPTGLTSCLFAEIPTFSTGEERYSGDFLEPDCTRVIAGEEEGFRGTDNYNSNNVGIGVRVAKRKRKCVKSAKCGDVEDGAAGIEKNPKKTNHRASKDKVKKNARRSKKQKITGLDGNGGEHGNIIASKTRVSSTCSSEENPSIELNNRELDDQNTNEASALSSGSKSTRASRGAATDPQSLYARRRRERINERLRILQNLVPNGTKVDISTMLEEAVHYVKFLQLQIKLLSSDDMWMYAPIAYNGMDIGLNQIVPPRLL